MAAPNTVTAVVVVILGVLLWHVLACPDSNEVLNAKRFEAALRRGLLVQLMAKS